MNTKIASWGEERVGRIALQNILIRLAKAAEEAEDFIARKMDGWSPSQQAEMIPDFWNGREPRFTHLMKDFRVAMKGLRSLAREDREIQQLVCSIPPIEWNLHIKYVRWVLRAAARVANAYLIAHPVKEVRPVGRIYVTVFTILCWVHQGVWVVQKRIRGRKDD